MGRFLFLNLIFSLFLALSVGCGGDDPLDEFRGDGSEESDLNEACTPGALSLEKSFVEASTNTVLQGAQITVTLITKDGCDQVLTEGGETVEFFHEFGTSAGSFSSVTDLGDGNYEATFTGDQFGTETNIKARINSEKVLSQAPKVQVTLGTHQRPVLLSEATAEADMQIRIELDSSNFTYSNAEADGRDIRFVDLSQEELPFWIERFDPAGTSTLWVLVNEAGTQAFSLVYGNPNLSSASSKSETFSYDQSYPLYAELSSLGGGVGQSTNLVSYIDNNQVLSQISGGDQTDNVDRFEVFNVSNLVGGVIESYGGLSGRALNFNNTFDSIAPFSFADTSMGYTKSRSGSDTWELYNPSGGDANVNVSGFDASGVLRQSTSETLASGSFSTVSLAVDLYGLIESDTPIIGFYRGGTNEDGVLMMGADTEIYGVNSKGAEIGITEDATTGTIYYSDLTSSGFSGDKGDTIATKGGGNQGAGEAIRVVSNKPVIANSQADSDGTESMAFWPRVHLDNEYALPADTQYFVIACPHDTSITVTNPDGTPNDSFTCDANGNYPGYARRGTTGAGTSFSAGTQITGDQVFFIYYEYDDEDESNVTGSKSARRLPSNSLTATVGDELTF